MYSAFKTWYVLWTISSTEILLSIANTPRLNNQIEHTYIHNS